MPVCNRIKYINKKIKLDKSQLLKYNKLIIKYIYILKKISAKFIFEIFACL